MFVRFFVNLVFSHLLKGLQDASIRTIDRAIFRTASVILKKLGVAYAGLIEEAYALDTTYLVMQSVVDTPYGIPLAFRWPLAVTIGITGRCAFHCRYCYADSENDATNTLSLELIEKLANTPIPHFLITGGEPMLDPRISQVLQILLEAGKHIYITTNTPASTVQVIAPFIQKYRGQIILVLSLWGDRARHDAIRGPGSFNRTMILIDYLASIHAYCWVNAIIADPELTCLDALAGLDVDKLDGILVTRVIQVGRRDANSVNWDQDFLIRLSRKALLIQKKLGETVHIGIPEAAILSNDRGLKNALLRALGIQFPQTCSAGVWSMYVDPAGQCYPCFASQPQKALANLHDHSVQEAWQIMQAYARTRPAKNVCIAELEKEIPQEILITARTVEPSTFIASPE